MSKEKTQYAITEMLFEKWIRPIKRRLEALKTDFEDWQEIFQKELNTLGNENLDIVERIEKLEEQYKEEPQ